MSQLNMEFVRGSFPALSDQWALFDNAGGSVPLGGVIERVRDYMSTTMVQLGASYRHSREAGERVDAGKRAMAALLGASPDEIVLGSSTTTNAKVLAAALAPDLRAGDEVIVTNLDHEANVGPWRALEERGARIVEWRFDPDSLELELVDLEKLLTDRTKLVCFTHASNLIGTIHDVAAIAEKVHEAGARAVVDGVAFAPHRRVDVGALDVDFYLLSLYKTYGPHLGLLYGKREHLERLKGQNHFFVPEDDVPYKLEPGNVNHELAASLPAIPEYLAELDARCRPGGGGTGSECIDAAFTAIAAHEAALVAPLLDFLSSRPDVRILGLPEADPARRVPTVSFVVDGLDSATVPPRLDEERIAIRYGHFYAHRAVTALGLHPRNGVIRVSMVHYNTPAEVARLVAALDRALD